MEKTLKQIKALADGNRLRIIMALATNEELCVCQITELLQVSTPTVSRHMSVLQNAGLVENRKDARWVHYRLTRDFPTAVLQWIQSSTSGSPFAQKDQQALDTILAYPAEVLCKARKHRQTSNRITKMHKNTAQKGD